MGVPLRSTFTRCERYAATVFQWATRKARRPLLSTRYTHTVRYPPSIGENILATTLTTRMHSVSKPRVVVVNTTRSARRAITPRHLALSRLPSAP